MFLQVKVFFWFHSEGKELGMTSWRKGGARSPAFGDFAALQGFPKVVGRPPSDWMGRFSLRILRWQRPSSKPTAVCEGNHPIYEILNS